MFFKNAASFLIGSLFLFSLSAHAVENKIEEIRYSPFWCPRPEEIAEISKVANLTMRGCCIEKATLMAGIDRAALKPWAWREYTGSNSACSGTVLSEDEAAEQSQIGQSRQQEIDAIRAEEAAAESIRQKQERARVAAMEAEERARRARPGVRIGMTKQQVLKSNWGEPESVNRTITAHGTREQWVYGDRQYLYFDNGRLVAIQD